MNSVWFRTKPLINNGRLKNKEIFKTGVRELVITSLFEEDPTRLGNGGGGGGGGVSKTLLIP